ncbi:MAG TPA: hypothetical protein VJZ01_10240 [Lachnospiraceae bacterium]|jgi:hypothetical protein|nr:hypothetical protein [Lachnospiraceae bacterium]
MTLSEKDGKLYYELWLPLLDFVNQKYRVNRKVKKMAGAQSLEPADVKAVSDKLCENPQVIDEYLSSCPNMLEEHRNIVEGWKRSIKGRFIIERHLKSGSILISMEDETVYQVSGIITSIEEMFYYAPVPLMVEAILMPFRDVIITDGLIMPYNLMIGRNMKREFKEVYLTAKRNGELKKSL